MSDLEKYGINELVFNDIVADCKNKGICERDVITGLKLLFSTFYGVNEGIPVEDLLAFGGLSRS